MSKRRKRRGHGQGALGLYSEPTVSSKVGVETYDEDLDKVCMLQTPAGRDLGRHEENTGRYRICLSKTQYKRLFGNSKPVFLGKGAAAVAWAKGDNRVIKITRDPDDIAALVAAKGMKHVVKAYKIYELQNAGVNLQNGMDPEPLRLWAVVAERLNPVDEELREIIYQIPSRRLSDHYAAVRDADGAENYTIGPKLRRELTAYACNDAPSLGRETRCWRFIPRFLETFEKLGRRGILFLDTHDGNFAQTAKGDWKIIDLGISDTRMPPPVLPILAGIFSGKHGTPHYRLRMPRVEKLR